jgi:hypothetical protein
MDLVDIPFVMGYFGAILNDVQKASISSRPLINVLLLLSVFKK